MKKSEEEAMRSCFKEALESFFDSMTSSEIHDFVMAPYREAKDTILPLRGA